MTTIHLQHTSHHHIVKVYQRLISTFYYQHLRPALTYHYPFDLPCNVLNSLLSRIITVIT